MERSRHTYDVRGEIRESSTSPPLTGQVERELGQGHVSDERRKMRGGAKL
jgi:hypothetical protein